MVAEGMLARVRADGVLQAARPVVVLLSGGRDSTCLLDLAVRVAGAESVAALHVNYGIRESAPEDDRHCRALCAGLGVRLEVHRPAPPDTGNLQAWAREVRYREAAALAAGADVAAGHTKTDQVETILYRLASSPSRRALLGMRPRDGTLIRPLLSYTREDTAAYCAERGLEWREDETNASDAFARNRIRADLVPALRAVHPAAEDNVLTVAEILRAEGEVLDALVRETLQGRAGVSLARLRELPAALRRLVVQRLADEAGGGIAPGVGGRAEDVAALSERGTAMLDIGCGLRAVAEYGELRIERLGSGPGSPASGSPALGSPALGSPALGSPALGSPAPVRLAIPGSASFGAFEVRCEVGPPAREPGVLDRDALGTELLVRSWRAGDRMAPLGLDGTKSLQDLFTARRVPRAERSGLPVVEAGGEIVWVAGVATSERFKVTDETRQAVRLLARPAP